MELKSIKYIIYKNGLTSKKQICSPNKPEFELVGGCGKFSKSLVIAYQTTRNTSFAG